MNEISPITVIYLNKKPFKEIADEKNIITLF